MGNKSVTKFVFRLSRFPVYRGSVLGRFYCISMIMSDRISVEPNLHCRDSHFFGFITGIRDECVQFGTAVNCTTWPLIIVCRFLFSDLVTCDSGTWTCWVFHENIDTLRSGD